MTQYGYEPLSPEDSGSTLLARVNGVVPALLTNHKGAARPAYVQPGTLWIDDSGASWLLNLFDGQSDISIATINPVDHTLTLAGLSELYGKAAFKSDGTPGAPVIYDENGSTQFRALRVSTVGLGKSANISLLTEEGKSADLGFYSGGIGKFWLSLFPDGNFGVWNSAMKEAAFAVVYNTNVVDFQQIPSIKGTPVTSLFGGAGPKKVVEISATGAYKPTAGTKYILAILRGGGGGGGGNNGSSNGGGAGGEGALGLALIPVDPAVTYAVTVGYGGSGNTARNNGYDGGATSIVAGGVTYLAGGGQGGQVSGAGGVGGTPGNTCILGFMGAAGVGWSYPAAPVWRQMGAAYGTGGGPSQASGQSGSSTGGTGYIGHVTILEFGS